MTLGWLLTYLLTTFILSLSAGLGAINTHQPRLSRRGSIDCRPADWLEYS